MNIIENTEIDQKKLSHTSFKRGRTSEGAGDLALVCATERLKPPILFNTTIYTLTAISIPQFTEL